MKRTPDREVTCARPSGRSDFETRRSLHRGALAAMMLAIFASGAAAQEDHAVLSSIPSDGALGTDTTSISTFDLEFPGMVRGVRLSGTLLRVLDTSLLSQAHVQVTTPSGNTIDITPVVGQDGRAMVSFFDVFYELPLPEPTGSGQWTLTFHETVDDAGGADSLWESFEFSPATDVPAGGPPANDSHLNPIEFFGPGSQPFDYPFLTHGATSDGPPVPCPTGLLIRDDVWFQMTAVETEIISLSLCGNVSFDAAMAVYEGAAMIPITCDDDACGIAGDAPMLEFQAQAGQTYLVQIGGLAPGSQGTGVLTVQSATGGASGAAGAPNCLVLNGGGYRPGHTWAYYQCTSPCRNVHKLQALYTVGASSSSFVRRYASIFAFDRDCLVNETVNEATRYDVVFWVAAGAGQPWLVKVDTRREGDFVIDNDGPNASTVTLTPVNGFVTSYIPVGGGGYVPGNASILSGTMSTGTNYGWSEGNSNCASQGIYDTSSAIITGVGAQSIHLNFDWNSSITSGDEAGIRIGPGGGFLCPNMNSLDDVGLYGGCNGRSSANDGHFVSVMCLVPNDICQTCTPAGLGTTFGSNVGATTDSTSTCPGGEADVFYCFRSVCGGPTTINTCGSNFDTILSVHGACPAGAGNQIVCNDDAFSGPCAGSSQSQVTFNAAPCTTYYIRVAGFGNEQGSIVLNISQPPLAPPANDQCANATMVGAGVFSYSTCGATTDGPPSCPMQRDVWYKFRPSCYSTVTVGPCGAPCMTNPNVKALFQVYEGPCGALTIVPYGTTGCRIMNNASGCPSPSNYSFQASPCKDYYIRLGTNTSAGGFISGLMSITQSAPSNDLCANATAIGTGTVFGGTTCATADGGANCGATTGTRDVWYSFTPTCSGPVTVHTCMLPECGSFYDTVVSVHTGCTGTAVNQIVCNDDDAAFCNNGYPWSSRVSFYGQACVKYLIRVSGYAGRFGNFALTVNQNTSPPVNDLCANAIMMNANTSQAFSTCLANTDGPAGCPVFGDVWYKFTACSSGPFVASTCGSPAGQNTSLAVHTGPSCSALSFVACNDNNGPSCAGNLASVSFGTVVGQTYYIRVGSPTPGTSVCGTLTLSGNNPATPVCPPGGATCTKMYTIMGTANGLPFTYRLSSLCCFDICRSHPGVPAGSSDSAIAASWAAHINAQCGGVNLSATSFANQIIIKTKGCACNMQLAVGPNGTPCDSLCIVTTTSLPTSGPCAFNPEIVEEELSGHDCNGNGEDDTIDLLRGTSLDADGDGIPDECVHRAGDFDKCEAGGQPADVLTIRADFANFLRRPAGNNAMFHGGNPLPFDEMDPDHWAFGYTFDLNNTPPPVRGRLIMHVKAGPHESSDDGPSLQFFRPPPSFVWSAFFADLDGDGDWVDGEDRTFTLDLTALPNADGTTTNIIDRISHDGFLDVYVQNGTAVDYLELVLEQAPMAVGACCIDRCTCIQLPEAECLSGGGTFLGEGMTCMGEGECYPTPSCPCDWNGTDGLDSQDLFDFYESFFGGSADFNCFDGTDSQDFFDYLECFFNGCP